MITLPEGGGCGVAAAAAVVRVFSRPPGEEPGGRVKPPSSLLPSLVPSFLPTCVRCDSANPLFLKVRPRGRAVMKGCRLQGAPAVSG